MSGPRYRIRYGDDLVVTTPRTSVAERASRAGYRVTAAAGGRDA